MVHQGIVLGHIISKQDIEVDKAKVELIVKLPSPTTVKGDAKFVWDDRCQRSFEKLKLFLTTPPIVRAPNWQLPFEVMCDASDFAIRVVLGQREDGKPYVIYYTSKTLNEAQRNYITTEKELLVDAKARLIRWILLLQEFNLQIKDKKGVENVVADHLSRLAIAHNSHSLPINDDFPGESLMLIEVAHWYAHIANYLVTGEVLRVDYVSKWVEAIPCKHNDHKVVLKFLKENIFSRFRVPKVIISDGGTHFCNKPFETLLAKYGVKHKVATPYHPQTFGQVELVNREIKNILMKVVNTSIRDWPIKLHDSLWVYRTAYKTIFGMSPYSLVYGKACHLFMEVEYKAWWAIKKLNMDLSRAGMKRGGHTDSSPSRNPRPRASSPQDSTSQAPEAPTIPSSESGVPSNPPKCRYETWRPPTTPGAISSCRESSVRCTLAKRARTPGPGESSRSSQSDPRATADSQCPFSMS
ncbi:Gag-Pol polyprotein [Vitis vinifera]|uniref:Gag-Pol polyprotein n=1 Tax=Vitis vinifera TaxID=29760 RepID=A0A438E182_VITVI|nr:Gag-Pol polyprotein [Vitis vinifera]